MKHFLPLLFALLTTPLWSQTGNGVVLLTDASYTFTPTTVDSTASFSFQLVNEVGVAQTVFFGALDAPFSLDDNTPVEIPSQDTIDVTIHFTPTDLGAFQDTISFVGSVFGSAELALAGDGIQVIMTWTPDTLSFDTTAIGQTNSQTIAFSSIGDGAGTITDIEFSSDIFSIDSANSAFIIPEGGSDILTVVYAPINAGTVNETMTLSTNDPNNPNITINLTAVGISEVSGEICDITWTIINSPYTLTGDVIIPEGCTLNIDPGVEVIGNNYNLAVFGSLFANGDEGNEISIEVGELLSHTSAENVVINRTTVTETNVIDFMSFPYSQLIQTNPYSPDSLSFYLNSTLSVPYFNENAQFGRYYEDFSDNDCQGWTLTQDSWPCPSSISQTCNGTSYNQVDDNCSSSYWGWIRTYSPTFELMQELGETPDQVSFVMDTYNIWQGYNGSYIDYNIAYSINGGGWTNLENSGSYLNNATKTFDLTSLQGVETIQFRMSGYFRYRGAVTIDNFEFTTNFYSGSPAGFTSTGTQEEFNTSISTLSTGGITLTNSIFYGDFQSVNSSVDVYIDHSSILANEAVTKSSNGLGLYVFSSNAEISNSQISGHTLSGIKGHSPIGGSISFWGDLNSISDNGGDGINMNGAFNFMGDSTEIINNGGAGIHTSDKIILWADELTMNNNANGGFRITEDGYVSPETQAQLTVSGGRIQNNGGSALTAIRETNIFFDYVLIDDNEGRGIDLNTGLLNLSNCRISGNDLEGIHSGGPVSINHCDLAFNGGTGLALTGNNFHTLNNSILWGNNSSNYTQIDIGGGVISTSYSTVQGRSSYGTSGSGQYYWGEGVIEADPLFADDDLHLEIFSPCVDGGQPWHQDAYMPFGLGGVRADMGMYGGPDNAYWGGTALPDGASALNSITDSPQDQGGVVGLTFGASFYDNSELVNNVTSYAFWRHYDPTGQAISTLDEGNWELIGEMPAQSFNGYAYQAATLGNTNDTGPFSSCFTVVAHTDDPDTYWYSNVMCGESVDNLAPGAPDLNGMPLEEGGALISWADPAIEDYGYTRIVSDAGFEAEISADTLVVDAGALAGSTVTYTATHFDVNGNESEPTDLTLVLGSAFDVIPLNAGWNLISLDRAPDDASIATLFGDLIEDNLLYVTGFDNGVTFHDPNGLSFLNTLSGLTPGYGYWVKVAQDDTLRAPGTPLGGGYLPTLDAGWNLIAYTADAPLAPEAFFADLIADGDLAYLTGFDNGVQVFDPNGLPFLNTLTTLNNGYGYWLKTSADYAGLGLVDDAKGANPNYVVLNGTSNLGAYAGQTVLVLDESGRQVAELPILEGGYLMTTAVYGGEAGEGLQPGVGLQLEFAGERIALDGAWTGDMAHLKLDVEFPIGLTVFPNPATDRVDLRWNQAASGQVRAEVFDATGKQVLDTPMGRFLSGWQQASIAVDALAPGHYTLHLLVDGRSVHQTALQRAE